MIFHVATEQEWLEGQRDGRYTPTRLARDGFVHCSGTLETAEAVIAAYFHDAGPLVILQLDEASLDVELKWEPPAPLTAGPHAHHQTATLFPHVYGSIPLGSVVHVARRPRPA
jgi:uncharacterized protein (DUF952 family)